MAIMIIILALFVALGLLAIRYGYDSRAGMHSKEESFASFGITWQEPADELQAQELAGEMQAARQRRLVNNRTDKLEVVPQPALADTLPEVA